MLYQTDKKNVIGTKPNLAQNVLRGVTYFHKIDSITNVLYTSVTKIKIKIRKYFSAKYIP